MATSGTFAWQLDIDDLIEEAYEQAGLEVRDSYNSQTARRSLNLLLTEWINEGVNLWTVELNTTATVAATASYTLNAKYYDLLDIAIRDSDGNDRPLDRVSYEEYLALPDKDLAGTPNSALVERKQDAVTVTLWPVPEDATETIVYYSLRYMEDVDAMQQNPDIPRRFVPALTTGLAVEIAIKNPARMESGPDGRPIQVGGVNSQHLQTLQAQYARKFTLAREEDRERDTFRVRVNAGM
jgi:hypothetical protein